MVLDLPTDPFFIVPVCHRCGASGRIEADRDDWGTAVKWGRIALGQHDCPVEVDR